MAYVIPLVISSVIGFIFSAFKFLIVAPISFAITTFLTVFYILPQPLGFVLLILIACIGMLLLTYLQSKLYKGLPRVGLPGVPGMTGVSGARGLDGENGLDGIDAPDGFDAPPSKPGYSGKNGNPDDRLLRVASDGPKGAKGVKGAKGEKGETPPSALSFVDTITRNIKRDQTLHESVITSVTNTQFGYKKNLFNARLIVESPMMKYMKTRGKGETRLLPDSIGDPQSLRHRVDQIIKKDSPGIILLPPTTRMTFLFALIMKRTDDGDVVIAKTPPIPYKESGYLTTLDDLNSQDAEWGGCIFGTLCEYTVQLVIDGTDQDQSVESDIIWRIVEVQDEAFLGFSLPSIYIPRNAANLRYGCVTIGPPLGVGNTASGIISSAKYRKNEDPLLYYRKFAKCHDPNVLELEKVVGK